MIYLTGESLTFEDAEQVVFHKEKIKLAPEAREAIQRNRRTVEDMLKMDQTMYGINTGFGKFSDIIIRNEDLDSLQKNLIYSHACGVGEPFSKEIGKTMLLLRANTLAQGYSGVSVELIEQLIDYINLDITPVIPQQGSLGASGDLAPLAHLALCLIGEGEVFYQGKRMETAFVLHHLGLTPLNLKAKEGLALINGTQAMTAVGMVTYLEMKKLLYQSELISGLTLEGLRGIMDAFDRDIHCLRGHQEQIEVADRMRERLIDSKLTTSQGELRVQDAYSLRCIPQVLGASWQATNYAKEKLLTEMNAVTDNPLIFSEQNKVVSGGNFHGQPVAFAMDFLKLGIAEAGNLSERRIERLVNPQLNEGLPPFLSPNPGLESGAMIMQYSAASLVSENKTLAHPASVDSIPSSANQEDHVSMGTIAARHALEMLTNTRRVIAIELICALEAVEHRGVEQMATQTREFYEIAREIVPPIKEDRVFSTDIERVAMWLKEAKESGVQNKVGGFSID